eukprot:4915914-Prymnesium_polylepis.1
MPPCRASCRRRPLLSQWHLPPRHGPLRDSQAWRQRPGLPLRRHSMLRWRRCDPCRCWRCWASWWVLGLVRGQVLAGVRVDTRSAGINGRDQHRVSASGISVLARMRCHFGRSEAQY